MRLKLKFKYPPDLHIRFTLQNLKWCSIPHLIYFNKIKQNSVLPKYFCKNNKYINEHVQVNTIITIITNYIKLYCTKIAKDRRNKMP